MQIYWKRQCPRRKDNDSRFDKETRTEEDWKDACFQLIYQIIYDQERSNIHRLELSGKGGFLTATLRNNIVYIL